LRLDWAIARVCLSTIWTGLVKASRSEAHLVITKKVDEKYFLRLEKSRITLWKIISRHGTVFKDFKTVYCRNYGRDWKPFKKIECDFFWWEEVNIKYVFHTGVKRWDFGYNSFTYCLIINVTFKMFKHWDISKFNCFNCREKYFIQKVTFQKNRKTLKIILHLGRKIEYKKIMVNLQI